MTTTTKTYTIKSNRTAYHIDGIEAATIGGGNDLGDRVSYAAHTACPALTRSGSRMQRDKVVDSLAEALRVARLLARNSGSKVCAHCEAAAEREIAGG